MLAFSRLLIASSLSLWLALIGCTDPEKCVAGDPGCPARDSERPDRSDAMEGDRDAGAATSGQGGSGGGTGGGDSSGGATFCDDSCMFALDGECDDGRQGADSSACVPGTDCTDCGGGVAALCIDDCGPEGQFNGDGDCDDGGPNHDFAECPYGHDCSDCGPRPQRECLPTGAPEQCTRQADCCGYSGSAWCVEIIGLVHPVCSFACTSHDQCMSGCCPPLTENGDRACAPAEVCEIAANPLLP